LLTEREKCAEAARREYIALQNDKEQYMKKMLGFAKTMVFSKQGIERFMADGAENPDGSCKSAPQFDADQASRIYDEGKAIGYHEYSLDFCFVLARQDPNFKPGEGYKYMSDWTNPRQSEATGYVLGGALGAPRLKTPALDQRIWQAETITRAMTDRLIPDPPMKGSYWEGIHAGLANRGVEIAPLVEKVKKGKSSSGA
jgi:hypothetical protein